MGSTDSIRATNPQDNSRMHALARRAYEWGRVRHACWTALVVIPMVGLSLMTCRTPAFTLAAGASLMALALGFAWRGQTFGRAVVPGFVAGSVPLLLPLLLRSGGHCCIGGICWTVCMIGCIGGGLVAGIAVGVAAASHAHGRWTFLAAASLVAGFTGMLGCATAGFAGIAGMALAVIASSLPVAVASRLRPS